jgi:hypothetical protein
MALSLTEKRAAAGAYLSLLLFFAANRYLDWQLLGGGWDKKVLAVVQFVGVVLVARFGPALVEEIKEYRARNRQTGFDNEA